MVLRSHLRLYKYLITGPFWCRPIITMHSLGFSRTIHCVLTLTFLFLVPLVLGLAPFATIQLDVMYSRRNDPISTDVTGCYTIVFNAHQTSVWRRSFIVGHPKCLLNSSQFNSRLASTLLRLLQLELSNDSILFILFDVPRSDYLIPYVQGQKCILPIFEGLMARLMRRFR
jgi:hypothetical protein